jgi:hypothetical protein
MTCGQFTVSGKWPFPVDMLRHDGAAPATAEDAAKIEALSRDHCDDPGFMHERHSVVLVITDLNARSRPCEERWDSFGWHVENGDLAARRRDAVLSRERQTLRASAMAKLTPEERDAIAWYKGR